MSNIFALTAVLETHGVHCTIANNGFEALALIEGGSKFDLILMDIMMPEMDGYEAMRRIRRMDAMVHVPIIALTAKAMADDREKCIDAGANDYLSKPLDGKVLLETLQLWLASAPDIIAIPPKP